MLNNTEAIDWILKRRLISLYRKKQKDLVKMRKCLRPEKLKNEMNQTEISMKHEQLELVEDYL